MFGLHCRYADKNSQLEPYDMGEILEDVPNGLLDAYSTNMQGGEEGIEDICILAIAWSRMEYGQKTTSSSTIIAVGESICSLTWCTWAPDRYRNNSYYRLLLLDTAASNAP
jgi:hypothetical protein